MPRAPRSGKQPGRCLLDGTTCQAICCFSHVTEMAQRVVPPNKQIILSIILLIGTFELKSIQSRRESPRANPSPSTTSISFYLFFSIPFIHLPPSIKYSVVLVLLPPSRDSDPGSHTVVGSYPPLPSTVRALHFFLSREGLSTFFPCRQASNCAYPRYDSRFRQLVPFLNSIRTEFRTHDVNAMIVLL